MLSVILTTGRPPCVDLRATFGGQYRFTWDPAYAIEQPRFRVAQAPWLTRIPCRHGFIFPWGGRRLAAYATGRRRALEALSVVHVAQGGGPGAIDVIVTFDVEDLPAVADLLQAKRRRTPSPETLARLQAWAQAQQEARRQATFRPQELRSPADLPTDPSTPSESILGPTNSASAEDAVS